MRGKENDTTIIPLFIRITPAYAGKSLREDNPKEWE